MGARVTRTPPLEREIQKAIIEWLNLQYGCKAWRSNTGAVVREYKGKKRFTRFGQPGMSDIIGIYRGRFLAVEVKRPGNRPTTEQALFLQEIRTLGGIAFVATSVDDCEAKWREAMLTWNERQNKQEAIEAAQAVLGY